MTIEERIAKLSPYFKEMQVTTVEGKQVIYVVVEFPEQWVVDDDVQTKFNVSVMNNPNGVNGYYFAADVSDGFDKIFDAIDFNVAAMKDAEERTDLYKTKLTELKSLFSDKSIPLDSLRTLTFNYNKENSLLIAKNSEPEDKDSKNKDSKKNK